MPPALDSSSRPRMPIACAECRRLKLKCDKSKPCSSCTRRGCASICPQGRMVSKGSRLILANTRHLHFPQHEKIEALISRVRQLELALEASYALHSSEAHPLLEEELRLIATPVEIVTTETEPIPKGEELTEYLGTLTLDKSGTQYFGTAGAYALLRRDQDGPDGAVYKSKGEVSLALAELPSKLAHMAQSFPLRLPIFDDSHFGAWILENCLPPFPAAWSLIENYWEYYAWHFSPITRTGFVEQIFSPLYHRSPDDGDKPLGHRLGLLFMVFAMGDLLDLTKPWDSSRGLRFYLLARASLCLDPVFQSPTVTALQAMHLMAAFLLMSRGTNEPEHAWVLSGINLKLALTLGLQHDATKFNLCPEEVESRQNTSLSVLSIEVWQSLCVGRLPSQTLANFNWVFPKDEQSNTKLDSAVSQSTIHWIASFMRECSCKVLDTVVGNKVTSYRSILELDAKIREFPVLELSIDESKSPEELGIGTTIQYLFLKNFRQISLLYLHRHCFALALRDFPDDPLKSPFAPSVMACQRIATTYLTNVDALYSALPTLTVRIWFIWPHVFVSTLILGSIVARCPSCTLALPSLMGLEKVCQLWEASSESVCAGKVLDIVRRLRQKAFTAFSRNKTSKDVPANALRGTEVLDEIHALGGYGPRVISTRPSSTASTPSPYSPSLKVASESSQSPPSSNRSAPPSTHPSDDYVSSHIYGRTPDEQFSAPPVPEPINPSNDHAPSHLYDKGMETQFSAPSVVHSAGNSLPSMEMSFDWETFDYSSYLPTTSDNTVPTNFDVFDAMGNPAPHDPQNGPTLLEELGLGGEWQPVMDYLGL